MTNFPVPDNVCYDETCPVVDILSEIILRMQLVMNNRVDRDTMQTVLAEYQERLQTARAERDADAASLAAMEQLVEKLAESVL
jgi:hypothetical protein